MYTETTSYVITALTCITLLNVKNLRYTADLHCLGFSKINHLHSISDSDSHSDTLILIIFNNSFLGNRKNADKNGVNEGITTNRNIILDWVGKDERRVQKCKKIQKEGET